MNSNGNVSARDGRQEQGQRFGPLSDRMAQSQSGSLEISWEGSEMLSDFFTGVKIRASAFRHNLLNIGKKAILALIMPGFRCNNHRTIVMLNKRIRGFAAVCFLALASGAAQAAIITYTGEDAGAVAGGATPNSDAAAASFDAAAGALGALSLIDFESAPLGTFSALMIAPGVTLSGISFTGGDHQIRNTDRCGNVCGFNTTAGGDNYVDVDAGFITFDFSTGVQAFGVYITGLQLAGETVVFDDGTSQTLTLNNPGSGAQFFGFTDAGKSIASIMIDTRNPSNNLGDFVGLDDVRYVSGSVSVPEPGTLAILGAALFGLAWRRRAA